MKRLAVITLALAACNTFAGTDEPIQNDTPGQRFYVQAEAGYARQDFRNKILLANRTNNEVASALRIGTLRALRPDLSLGLEFGYFHLGNVRYYGVLPGVNIKSEQGGLDLLFIAQKKLNDRVNLFGKVGAAFVEQENTVTAAGSVQLFTPNGNQIIPKAALGIGVNLSKNLELTATGSHIFSKKIKVIPQSLEHTRNHMGDVASSSSVMLGLRYSFG